MDRIHDNQVHPAANHAVDELLIERVLRHVHAGRLTLEQASELVRLSACELERRLRHLCAETNLPPADAVLTACQAAAHVRITNVSFDARCMYVRLWPTHEIAVPLDRLPILAAASSRRREQWEIVDNGSALEWPELHLRVELSAMQRAVHDVASTCEQFREATLP